MSYTIEDNLKSNYKKAVLDEGRNVLVKVCTVLLNGVPVAIFFTTLSNTQRKSWGFNGDQIREIESGLPLHKMDTTLLHLMTRAFKLVAPGHLEDLLKELKVERNQFAHQQHTLSLDKAKLRRKLAELKSLYTKILQELQSHCDPALIPSLDQDIIDTRARLLFLENTLDDTIHEKTVSFMNETTTAVTMIGQSSATLDQSTAKVNSSIDTLRQEVLNLQQIIEKTTKSFQDIEIQQQPAVQGNQQQSPDNIYQQLKLQQPIQLDLLVQNNDPLIDFVLHTRKYHMETTNFNPISIIKESADFNGLNVDFLNVSTDSSKQECKLFIGGYLIESSEGESIKLAKNAAATQALQSLRARCYTLQVLKRHIGKETVTIDSITSSSGTTDSSPKGSSSFSLPKMFVYSDGGLCRKGKATFDPIKLEAVIGSQGLDMKVAEDVTNQFKQSIAKILHDFLTSDQQDDLIFSPEFTKEQRKEIQRTASYLNLKGNSTGKGNDRFVAISRKDKFDKTNILHEVMKNRRQTEKYKLLKPGEAWFDDE